MSAAAAMDNRLLRPRAGDALDPDAATYIAAIEAADLQALEPEIKGIINTFIVGCKADGIWNALQYSCGFLLFGRTLDGGLVPLRGPAPANSPAYSTLSVTPFVAADYDRYRGLLNADDTPAKYLRYPFDPGTLPQNDVHASVWVTRTDTINSASPINSGRAQTGALDINIGNTVRVQSQANQNFSVPGPRDKFFAISRLDANEFLYFRSGVVWYGSVASQTPFSGDFTLYIQSVLPVTQTSNFVGRIAWWSVGLGLTHLQLLALEARVSAVLESLADLDSDANTYLAAVEQADSDTLEAPIKRAVRRFVQITKDFGWWDENFVADCCLLAGPRTLNGALTPLRGAVPTNNNFVAGDYSRFLGLTGDGSTKSLTVGTTINSQDSHSLAIFSTSVMTTATSIPIGYGLTATTAASHLATTASSATISFRSRNTAGTSSSFHATRQGGVVMNREDGSTITRGMNFVSTGSANVSTSGAGTTSCVFATYDPAVSGPASYSPARLAYFHAGGGTFLPEGRSSAGVGSGLNPAARATMVLRHYVGAVRCYGDTGLDFYTLHPDCRSWLSRVYELGGSATALTVGAVNTFCHAITDAGLRYKFHRLNLLCGDSSADLIAVRTPLYLSTAAEGYLFLTSGLGMIDANINFVQADYAETGVNGGLTGNGTTKYLDLNYAPNLNGLNTAHGDCHLSVYGAALDSGSGATVSPIGHQSSTGTSQIKIRTVVGSVSDTRFEADDVATTQSAIAATAVTQGHVLGTSSSDSDLRLFHNGANVGSNTTTRTLPAVQTGDFFVFASSNGTTAENFCAARICAYSIGKSMTDAEALVFYTALHNFQTALGRQVI